MSARPQLEIIQPTSPDELAATAELFMEYATSLGIDLSFQNFAAELAE